MSRELSRNIFLTFSMAVFSETAFKEVQIGDGHILSSTYFF